MQAEFAQCDLEAGSLVIGDLHLDVSPGAPAHTHFCAWLAGLAGVPRLIVLGDLFDAWVGPAHLEIPTARAVVAALRACVDAGTAIDVIPGNRDFLLEQRFELHSGVRVLRAGLLGRLPAGRCVLFVHGDELCTRDLGYQRLKRVVRSRPFAWIAAHAPHFFSLWFARRLRARSRSAVAAKPAEDKQQQPAAALELARLTGADGLVCGHAHVFRAERLGPTGPDWWVLDAWGGQRDLLRLRGPEEAQGPFEVLSAASLGPATPLRA